MNRSSERLLLSGAIAVGTAALILLILWIGWFRPYARESPLHDALYLVVGLVPGLAGIAAAEPMARSRAITAISTGLVTGLAIVAVWLVASVDVECGLTIKWAAVVGGIAAVGTGLIVWIGSWMTARWTWVGAVMSLALSFVVVTLTALQIVATAAMAQNACTLTY